MCSQLPFSVHCFIVLYADSILSIAPPVTELQRLLTLVETEIEGLAITNNVNKYCCIRILSRHSVNCVCLKTAIEPS